MAAASVICILCALFLCSSCQYLGTKPYTGHGICRSMVCKSIPALQELENCVVIVGSLQVSIIETAKKIEFTNITFPNLREVTGFVVIYRVQALESLGQLFPNLARIRGAQLLNNYGLIVYDMTNLREIGLFSLLKIDRGGVIVWGVPQACFVETLDWKSIAPRSRHVISIPDKYAHCNMPCSCSTDVATNHCWNNRKCQRFLDGPEAEQCHEQCLGCRKTNNTVCSVCRFYTDKEKCVSRCPPDTIILPVSKYCISEEECKHLSGWTWNKTCVFECPVDYAVRNESGIITCKPCLNCHQTCQKQIIQTIGAIQAAERCVYINGSLEIHVRAIPDGMKELRAYLSRIQEVSDYVVIYGSITITSLDFLSSLRRIKGRKLKNGKYSLMIHDMHNMQTMFTPDVMKNLKIDRGTLRVYSNPVLCLAEIKKLQALFPVEPTEVDIPPGINGYSSGCKEIAVNFQIRVLNETSAVIMFSPVANPQVHYSVLYVRLPPGVHATVVPETCSDFEWFAVNVPTEFGYHSGIVELTSLHPASSYAVCIETFDPVQMLLARSSIVNFTTPAGKPQPPFIVELVASSSDVVVLHWVDHKDYQPHITRYELDVAIIDIHTKAVLTIDHCKYTTDNFPEVDYSRHAVVLSPPKEYGKGCQSMCGLLSSVTAGALVEESFDICNSIEFGCNNEEDVSPGNSWFGSYVRTLALNISSPRKDFQVGGLAPYRDYRFRLRACVGDKCSRSTRGVVRTLRSETADVPSIKFVDFNGTGYLFVNWEAPAVSNGLILAYNIEVLPNINLNELVYLLPQVWCVLANETSVVVKTIQANKYSVRVCSVSMASINACSVWMRVSGVIEINHGLWWTGVVFGFLIYTASLVIGCLWQLRRNRSDTVPLVDNTSSLRNESEPPIVNL